MDAALNTVLGFTYETQLFDFHPRQYIDGVYNVFYENVFEALKQFQEYLIGEKKEVVSPETIKLKTEFFFQELIKNLDKAMDKYEVFICRNFLCIPENLVLPEDKVHMTSSCTEEQELLLDQEIEELTQEIIKEKVRKSVLKQKKAEQKLVRAELVYFKEKLEEISNVIKQCSFTKETLDMIMGECAELCNFIKERGIEKS
ncbi:protein MIS12 homolog [Parasteatoda tepidariorum]|uniref:protein MIS12 homolog n=1 Tax=Parasteatoda tepidariorum TaxID=114398 RepID=UPI00077FA998|nr:protein MIS12 homolog [Parasteatoda tepidariorum]